MEAQKELEVPPKSPPESGGEGGDSQDPPKTYSKIMEAKIASLLMQAKAFSESGAPKHAVSRLSKAIVLRPDDPELFRLRGEAAVMAREYHTAIINFNRVIALRKSENKSMRKRLSAVYYQYGVDLAARERHEEAVDSSWNCEKHDANNKEAVARRMECLIAMQKYSECMNVIEKEVKKDDSNPDLYVVRAQLNMLFGQTAQGYLDVCKALEISSSHLEALEMKQDMEKKAKECKNQAIQKSLIGNREGALRKLNDAIQLDPGKAEYLILRGSVYRRMGDFNAAVDDLLSAMDKCEHRQDSPIYISASKQLLLTYNDFAMVCFKQRKFDSAVTLLNKAIKQEKGEKGLYLNRGDCFYRLGNLQFSLCDYQQALELDPTDWEVYCRVAVVYCEIGVELFGRGQYPRAEELFSAAIQHNPKVSWFYICRARARYELKNIAGSKEDVLFSILLDPKSDDCVSLLARVFAGKSKEELLCSREAVKAYIKLQSVIRHTANVVSLKAARRSSLHVPTAEVKKPEESPLKSALGLGSFELKVEKEVSERRKSIKGKSTASSSPLKPASIASSAKLEVGSVKSESVKSGSVKAGNVKWRRRRRSDASLTKPSSQPMTSQTVLLGSSQEGGVQELLSPREWSVLSYPLPEFPTSTHSLLASIQDAFKESHFHKSIYYSKKTCDTELEGVLKSRLRDYVRPPPPRVQNFHDIVIGGRSILTASSLIKSVK